MQPTPETRNPKPLNPKSETRNLKPATRNPKSETRIPKSETAHPKHQIPNLWRLSPQPPNPKLFAPEPQPQPPNPYRVTSLIRNCLLLGPYSRPMSRTLRRSLGGGAIFDERGSSVRQVACAFATVEGLVTCCLYLAFLPGGSRNCNGRRPPNLLSPSRLSPRRRAR